MTRRFNQYLGKGGHLAVMSEFLMRGWNVAIPEVDVGDDIFVVQDESGTLRRVQVKTATAVLRKKGFGSQYILPLRQLRNTSPILVHYVFIVRHLNRWTQPLLIRQDYLLGHYQNDRIGSEHEGNLTLYFSHADDSVSCNKVDLTAYIADYSDFPLILH
jgi:hypothetical protein